MAAVELRWFKALLFVALVVCLQNWWNKGNTEAFSPFDPFTYWGPKHLQAPHEDCQFDCPKFSMNYLKNSYYQPRFREGRWWPNRWSYWW